jgi:hypothetical protein
MKHFLYYPMTSAAGEETEGSVMLFLGQTDSFSTAWR